MMIGNYSGNILPKQQKIRLGIFLWVCTCVSFLLITRIYWLTVINSKYLSEYAHDQQTTDKIVMSERGQILDRNGKQLAVSVSSERIIAFPNQIKKSGKSEIIYQNLSEILSIDKEKIRKLIDQSCRSVNIKKKLDKETTDQIRNFIRNNKIKGLEIVEDVKRIYPFCDFASQVIGFVGEDNQGLDGIEKICNKYLQGISGRVLSERTASGTETPFNKKEFIKPQNGSNVTLTIDEVIQHFLEKRLERAVDDNKLACGATGIIMDVKTGEILAMATKPSFDLNAPFEVTNQLEYVFPGLREELQNLEGKEYSQRISETVQTTWRNKAVVDSYEPGSTFKIVTLAMALEENVVKLNENFYCKGSLKVGPHNIHCWKRKGHGAESFIEGVQNSCNPVFIQIGARVGAENFYNYAKKFGFKNKTGIELPGETSGIFFKENQIGEVQLATMSFGQGIQVTPLQMITFTSAVANGGKLNSPHIIKNIKNSNAEEQTPQLPESCQVVSESTCSTMKEILESVVKVGGAKNAFIPGYRVAGKTGTSEKLPRGSRKYIASFAGFAPSDDPKVAILIMLDDPHGDYYYGGIIAAPVARDVLEETLKYLNVEPRYTEEEREEFEFRSPNLIGETLTVAKRQAKQIGINLVVEGQGETVLDQIPKPFMKLDKESRIIVYTDQNYLNKRIKMPKVIGLTYKSAVELLNISGIKYEISNKELRDQNAICRKQSIEENELVIPGESVILSFDLVENVE